MFIKIETKIHVHRNPGLIGIVLFRTPCIIMILISSHNMDPCISESNIQKFIQKILIKNVHTYTRQTKVL